MTRLTVAFSGVSPRALPELPSVLPLERVDFDALADAEQAQLLSRHPSGRGLLWVGGHALGARLVELFSQGALRHLFASEPQLNAHDVEVAIRRLVSPQPTGLGPWLRELKDQQQLTLTHSAQKREAVGAASRFAQRCGVGDRHTASFCALMDELATNAIFDAPTDGQGRPRYAHLQRDAVVELAGAEQIVVRLGFDGARLGLSVADPFGALTVARVQESMARCLKKGVDQVSHKSGGAGIGLYYCFELASHLVVDTVPRQITQVTALIDLAGNYRDFVSRPKSINLFDGPLDSSA